jgi:hypothetical protein
MTHKRRLSRESERAKQKFQLPNPVEKRAFPPVTDEMPENRRINPDPLLFWTDDVPRLASNTDANLEHRALADD